MRYVVKLIQLSTRSIILSRTRWTASNSRSLITSKLENRTVQTPRPIFSQDFPSLEVCVELDLLICLWQSCLIHLFQNSVNARDDTIQYPWLVFGEKVKVHNVFIRDSTGVSDSILLLFGGKLECGATVICFIRKCYTEISNLRCMFVLNLLFFQGGHLQMLEGYIEFFMCPSLAECYLKLKEEADKLLIQKVNFSSHMCLFPHQ